MIEAKASDFYGYPEYTGKSYWKTTSNDPCNIDVSTLIEVEILKDPDDGKWYELDKGVATPANGKYFLNPEGNGRYYVYSNGVQEESSASINYSCFRFPDNKIMAKQLSMPGSFDTYGNYMYVAYPAENIVVRFSIAEGGSTVANKLNRDAEGEIVAGQYGKMDLGGGTAEEASLLSTPSLIKCNPDNGDFVVYSDGNIKHFKAFKSDGTYMYRFMDQSPSTPGHLEYPAPVGNDIEGLPTKPSRSGGLLDQLTMKFSTSNPSDADIRTQISNTWKITSLEFFSGTTGSQPTDSDGNHILVLNMWRRLSNGLNEHKLARITKVSDYFPESNCDVVPELTIPSASLIGEGDEIPSTVLLHKHQLSSNKTRISLLTIKPRSLSYNQFQLEELRYTYDRDIRLPIDEDREVLNKGLHSYQPRRDFKGSIRIHATYSKRDDSVKFIASTYEYDLNSYFFQSVKAVSAGAGSAGGAGLLLFVFRNSIPPLVELGTWLGIQFTLSGVLLGVGILVGATVLATAIFSNKERATAIGEIEKGSYSVSSGTSVSYARWYVTSRYLENMLGTAPMIADNTRTSITRGMVTLARLQAPQRITPTLAEQNTSAYVSFSIIKPNQAESHLFNRPVIFTSQELFK